MQFEHAFQYDQRRAALRPYKLVAARAADLILCPLVAAASILLKGVRIANLNRMPISRALFDRIGVLPIRNHYYEPLFTYNDVNLTKRQLTAIDFNLPKQLELLSQFTYQQELLDIPFDRPSSRSSFYYNNGSYVAGDAEFLYSMVRHLRPKRILEVGSGNSTLIVRQALERNLRSNPQDTCEHTCIEPYEQPWLEGTGIVVVRERVEDIDLSCFTALGPGDILFIDSSHTIRPGGDVLFLFQTVLPILNAGVYVHIHDIFTPWHYPADWLEQEKRLWNEQYLVEAFMTMNNAYSVVAMLYLLSQEWREELSAALPVYGQNAATITPGAFWIKKTN